MKFTLVILTVIAIFKPYPGFSQTAAGSSDAADIYLQIRKLNTLGSALYIAAHPDDENTNLLTWFSKERLFRTGYLSLTRGDGGQNLIGDEQGVELGLIRTQELLAARNIDGAEQFFSRAFDFGFSKSTKEALAIWDKEKILADAVWVIRKFQPDIIITRFPEDQRAGHGQHSASSTLAREAFHAAADPSRFADQFRYGVQPWQARRIVWNNYNFGYTRTDSVGGLKTDIGLYNPLLGKGYGEIAAVSRSQHKSQGNGSPAFRGPQYEFFSHVDGIKALSAIDEGIDISWNRIGAGKISGMIEEILKNYSLSMPELSIPALVALYKEIGRLPAGYWRSKKMQEIGNILAAAGGLWLDAYTDKPFAVQGDSLKVSLSVNNRRGAAITLSSAAIQELDTLLNAPLSRNINLNFSKIIVVPDSLAISQPYWLEQPMAAGSFEVNDQTLIGLPESPSRLRARFNLLINGENFIMERPILYRHTDPVKGEIYQPLPVIPPVNISSEPELILAKKEASLAGKIVVTLSANRNISNAPAVIYSSSAAQKISSKDTLTLLKGDSRNYQFPVKNGRHLEKDSILSGVSLNETNRAVSHDLNLRAIRYGHIPDIYYFRKDLVKLTPINLAIAGKKIGYIAGAGDKTPEALIRMGYEVTLLKEKDISPDKLTRFDAIITGVRAYNIYPWLAAKNGALNSYIRNGGNLIVQYNTASEGLSAGAIGPYPFTISRNRVTDEHSPVTFRIPAHQVFNYPNRITATDFDGWIQERAIYFAENADPAFEMPLAMKDPGEEDQAGSLLVASYGKGKFVYTGLVFFRELPAGIPGAYRLLANIIALNKRKENK